MATAIAAVVGLLLGAKLGGLIGAIAGAGLGAAALNPRFVAFFAGRQVASVKAAYVAGQITRAAEIMNDAAGPSPGPASADAGRGLDNEAGARSPSEAAAWNGVIVRWNAAIARGDFGLARAIVLDEHDLRSRDRKHLLAEVERAAAAKSGSSDP